MRLRGSSPGVTLIEILIAMGVFAFMGVMVYGSLAGAIHTQDVVENNQERLQEIRTALLRMTRELQSAFLVKNANQVNTEPLRAQTIFLGREDKSGSYRIDFTSFSHIRTQQDSDESDQCELSYFVRDAAEGDGFDLMRRESKRIDADPLKGGAIYTVIRNISSFQLEFYDTEKQEWVREWDSNNLIGQPDRVPVYVRISLGIEGPD